MRPICLLTDKDSVKKLSNWITNNFLVYMPEAATKGVL